MRIFKAFKLTISTLFLTLNLLNRLLPVLNKYLNEEKCQNKHQQIRIASLIALSLAAKYEERVAFKVTTLAKSLGFMSRGSLTTD